MILFIEQILQETNQKSLKCILAFPRILSNYFHLFSSRRILQLHALEADLEHTASSAVQPETDGTKIAPLPRRLRLGPRRIRQRRQLLQRERLRKRVHHGRLHERRHFARAHSVAIAPLPISLSIPLSWSWWTRSRPRSTTILTFLFFNLL